jgi:hypothetical protein
LEISRKNFAANRNDTEINNMGTINFSLLPWGSKEEVYRVMGPELRISHRLQKLVKYSWLFNLLVKISIRNKQVKELLSCMFYEVDLRKKLAKPSFYIKLLLNR